MPLTNDEINLQKAIFDNDQVKVIQLIERIETQKNFVLTAIRADKPDIAEILLKKFKNKPRILFRQSDTQDNIFHMTAKKGYTKIFAALLEIANDCKSLAWMDRNQHNQTPLHLAIKPNQLDIARLLLAEIKKHPNQQVNYINCINNDGNTALHHSCFFAAIPKNPQIILTLLLSFH